MPPFTNGALYRAAILWDAAARRITVGTAPAADVASGALPPALLTTEVHLASLVR